MGNKVIIIIIIIIINNNNNNNNNNIIIIEQPFCSAFENKCSFIIMFVQVLCETSPYSPNFNDTYRWSRGNFTRSRSAKLSYSLLREVTSTTLITEVVGSVRVPMRPHPMHAPPARRGGRF